MRRVSVARSTGNAAIQALSLMIAGFCALSLAYVSEPPPEWLWIFCGLAMLFVHTVMWWMAIYCQWTVNLHTTLLVFLDVVLMGEMRGGDAYVEKIRSALIVRMVIYFTVYSITC
jgi:hypothetical protein